MKSPSLERMKRPAGFFSRGAIVAGGRSQPSFSRKPTHFASPLWEVSLKRKDSIPGIIFLRLFGSSRVLSFFYIVVLPTYIETLTDRNSTQAPWVLVTLYAGRKGVDSMSSTFFLERTNGHVHLNYHPCTSCTPSRHGRRLLLMILSLQTP